MWWRTAFLFDRAAGWGTFLWIQFPMIFFWAFSVLFRLLTDAGKKAGIQYAHTIELNRRFLGDAFGIFLRWCLRTKRVLKFRFSNDVSGLFTYSIKSFQFVFITVSLSDSQSGSSQRVKEKQCITYFIRCIFWKSHFKVENESVVVERRRPIHDRKQRCFKAFRNISKMPPPPWSSYMCGYIRIHTHESSRKKSCQYAHKHLLFQFCCCFWKL